MNRLQWNSVQPNGLGLAMLGEMVRDYIRGLTDDELVAYLSAGPTYYEPEAIDAAWEEAEQRSLPLEYIEEGMAHQAEIREAAALITIEKAKKPLGPTGKILAFAYGFWLTLEPMSFILRLLNRRKITKRSEREARIYRHLGFAAMLLILLGLIIQMPFFGVICASVVAIIAILLPAQCLDAVADSHKPGIGRTDPNGQPDQL